jgi:hypothetical protein
MADGIWWHIAVLLAPFIQVIFALELTMRAMKKRKPFQPRSKWSVPICLVIIKLLVLASFLVADFERAGDFCFASLFWFVAHWARGLFAVLTTIVATSIICAVIIVLRLKQSTGVEVTERVTASRMVFYLALASVTNVSSTTCRLCLMVSC